MGAMRSGARAAFVLLAACASRALAQSPAWETFGPPLFQVNAVATAPDELTVYSGSADFSAGQSAIFRSVNGGHTWSTVVQAASGEFYSDLLVDPANPATLYAGALASGSTTRIYRSADSGATWTLGQEIPAFCVPSFAAGASAGAAFVACGTRLYKTGDAGLTWQEIAVPFTEPTRLTADGAGALLAYGQTTLFRSAAGGTSWQKVGNPLPCAGMNALRADPTNANVLVAGAGVFGAGGLACGGIYRSTNGGNTWTASSLTGVYVTDVTIDPHAPTRAFAAGSDAGGLLQTGGVYASLDGGATWSDTFLPASGAARIALSAGGTLVYAATGVGVYERTFTGGQASCQADGQTLCLDAARFRVRAGWTRSDGTSGQGNAVRLTGDTGYFWFFDSANVEVMVKVLEGCGVNGYRWVFASGLTNVRVSLTVTDVVTGTTNPYTNPQGTAFVPIQDTAAFPCN